MGIFYTFIGIYSILDYFNILFILELNSEFRDFQIVGLQTVILLFKGFVLYILVEYF